MLTTDHRRMLNWAAQVAAARGEHAARLFPAEHQVKVGRRTVTARCWVPWPSWQTAPKGVAAPRRKPDDHAIETLVHGGYVHRPEAYRRPIPPLQRIHTLTDKGWEASGVERPAKVTRQPEPPTPKPRPKSKAEPEPKPERPPRAQLEMFG